MEKMLHIFGNQKEVIMLPSLQSQSVDAAHCDSMETITANLPTANMLQCDDVSESKTESVQAKTAQKTLCSPKCLAEPFNGLDDSVSNFTFMMKSKHHQCLRQHNAKIDHKQTEKEDLQQHSKQLQLAEVETTLAHLNILHDEINELKMQRHEFKTYCEKIEEQLTKIISNHDSTFLAKHQIEQLQEKFLCECNRFSNALPIYARRNVIIEAVQKNQVVILIGETGSGKSTQVVQYLYDAGFCNRDELIACTQPRKMAAISLATRVSTEMGCSLGGIVGYRMGSTSKMSPSTRIVYMTDHALLNECIADPLLKKYSCIVIDEVHERSLDTDILLAFVKQCITLRLKMKVIITSATINPDIFVEYFGGSQVCPIVSVPGRVFPVEVVWNSSSTESPLDRDFVKESVNLVNKIHTEEPLDGDILVFLTSQRDIETACQLAQKELRGTNTVILALHGQLQLDQQNLIFKEYHNARKIVFSTNVAETSVTIPGIKYIVDTGLVKEMHFDPKRNMNSLDVCLISKSSAEQRKGRAGRVSPGRCYRLYTEDQYAAMRARTPPDILRMHLIHAVLKLYEFGVADVLSFDFVEAPKKCALQAAMKVLNFLGATSENQLTPLGCKLALLPLDPQLGKIVFDGIDAGIGLEATVSAAISSYNSNVFFRSGNEKMKQESDQMKIKFVHSGGDQLTCLHVYREWSLRKKEDRSRWCVKNYINAKTMRLVEETVKELCHILTNKFQINFQSSTPSLTQAGSILPRLYFDVFLSNLGVYLGHPQVGYSTVESSPTDETLVVFPGSSVAQNNEIPKYVIFEKTLKTSQSFICQVLPIDLIWVEQAIAQGKLPCNPTEVMKDRMVCPLIIDCVGKEVSMSLKRESKELIEKMKALCNGAPVQLDWSQQKVGRILIYSNIAHHKILEEFLVGKLDIYCNELKCGFHETGVISPHDNIRVVLGQGGLVQHLLMPHEYRTVVVIGKSAELLDEAKAHLLKYGDIVTISFKQFKNECKLYVTYSHPSMAANAVFSTEVDKVKLLPYLPKQSGADQVSKGFQCKVEWIRRERKNFAFIIFETPDDHYTANALLCNRSISLCGSNLKISPSKKNSLELFVTNLPKSVEEEEFYNVIDNILDECDEDIEYKLKFGFEKSYETTPFEQIRFQVHLERLLSSYAGKDQYKLNLLKPSPQHVWHRAYINFKDPSVGQKVMTQLDGEEFLENLILNMTQVLSTSVRFTPNIYKVICAELKNINTDLSQQFGQSLKFVNKLDKHGNTIVTIESDNVEVFIKAKTILNNLTLPLVIECNTPLLRHYILSKVSRKELDEIQSTTKTVILTDTRTMSISIYGTARHRNHANECLNQHVIQLELRGLSVHELCLKGPSKRPGLMKHIVSKYGIDLNGLVLMKGVESATLEPQKQILTVFSTNDAFEIIKKIADGYSLPVKPSIDAMQLECCICLCEIEDISSLYIMEYCGHVSHIECIEVQVSANAVTFPLQCAAKECQHSFVWQDCENLFKRTSLTLQKLLNASLKSFLAANKDKARNCPTPDCPMVYAVSTNGQRFVCSRCNINVCTSCHVQYHDELTCKMYQSSQIADKPFEEWLLKDPHRSKLCPNSKCAIPIEKINGCNLVHCTQCGTKICWVCSKYFEDEQAGYTHLRNVHGDIY